MDYAKKSLEMHEKKKGKLEIKPKVKLENKDDLSIAYTPGVAEPCKVIFKNPSKVFDLTIKANTVAVVTDGSAVLGLGNIGAEAALPVMEGKCVLFKKFANIDAFPICIKSQDVNEIVNIVKNIAPVFGGINLEDISAPRCFEIEEKLQDIGIPVMHDDQHGTSVVVFAALINAFKVVKKEMKDTVIVINGAGAAGIAIAKLLTNKVKDVILVDTKGIIYEGRIENMNKYKIEISKITNKKKLKGDLKIAVHNADVFIGVSVPNVLTKKMVKSMEEKPIIFAMANPDPEILPKDAIEAGAAIVGTGRSDYPNQINNVLAFPGIFRGALNAKAKEITKEMKIAAAKALAECIEIPTAEKIIASPFDNVAKKVADAVKMAAIKVVR